MFVVIETVLAQYKLHITSPEVLAYATLLIEKLLSVRRGWRAVLSALEVFWRGHSHITMLIIGGLCFLLIGQINGNVLTWNMPLPLQMGISAAIVTL